jgi:uncharacterized protein
MMRASGPEVLVRLTRWQVEILAFEIARELTRAKLVTGDVDKLAELLRHVVTEDLSVEDKLEAEVRDILTTHAAAMKQGGVDYAAMFEKVKKQLIRERKLVL